MRVSACGGGFFGPPPTAAPLPTFSPDFSTPFL
jgi:hypothetical protein